VSAQIETHLCDARVVDTAAGTASGPRTVVLRDGRIHAIVESAKGPGERVDARGLYLCPGLIDSHTHLFLDGGEDPLRSFLAADPEERLRTAAANARTALRAGILHVRDCGGPCELVFRFQQLAAAGELEAPHILCCGSPLMRPGGHCSFFGGEVRNRGEVRMLIERQLKQGAAFVKLIASGGGLTPGTHPGEPDLPLELMREAVSVAHANGVKVAAHCHATGSIQRAIEAGIDFIEHASFVSAGGRHQFDEELAARMREAGVIAGPTITGARRTASRFRQSGRWQNSADAATLERLEGRLVNTAHFHRLGVSLIAGTDCGITCTPFDSLPEELAAYCQAGLSKAQALRTATCDSARMLGLAETGEIRPGWHADLILLSSNPLDDLDTLRRPVAVIKRGRLIACTDKYANILSI
jgi:imidazolonepropionase-like amidohydrolase